MSNQEIEVKLESRKDSRGNEIQELKIGKKFIGEIKTVDGKLEAESSRKTLYHVKDVSEGVQALLSDYNLHK